MASTEVAEAGFLVSLLIVFDYIQWYSLPFTGCIPGENKEMKPPLFRAVYPFGFMCWTVQ